MYNAKRRIYRVSGDVGHFLRMVIDTAIGFSAAADAEKLVLLQHANGLREDTCELRFIVLALHSSSPFSRQYWRLKAEGQCERCQIKTDPL